MTGDRSRDKSKHPPTDDELRAAWQLLRAGDSAPQSADAAMPLPAPEPSDIAAALNGTLSEDDLVRELDRALRRGAADDVALLHGLRSAAHETLADGKRESMRETPRETARNGTPRSGGEPAIAPGMQRWMLPLAATLAVAVGVSVWKQSNRPDVNEGPVTRGAVADTPQLVAPAVGAVVAADTLRLTWRPVQGAASYSAELFDSGGQRIVSLSTADTSVLVTLANPADRERAAGWWITAQMADGRTPRSDLRPLNSSP